MKRTAFAVGLGIVFLVSARMHGAQTQDALTMLRAALGGDAVLNAVQTIRARGTIDGKPAKDHFELAAALPDRFVKTVRSISRSDYTWSKDQISVYGGWPQSGDLFLVGGGEDTHTSVTGFDGHAPIPAPMGYKVQEPPAQAARRLDNAHARLAEFLLPLMGGTPESYLVVARSEAHAITFSAVGGREWRLQLDDATHLPARMIWTYPVPPNASANWKPLTVQTDYSDFRVVNGVRWPHRLITQIDGKPSEDATIERYEVNVKLADKIFRK